MNIKEKPIWKLISDVREAVEMYDRSNDHIPHNKNADCIRCRLIAAFSNSDVLAFSKIYNVKSI